MKAPINPSGKRQGHPPGEVGHEITDSDAQRPALLHGVVDVLGKAGTVPLAAGRQAANVVRACSNGRQLRHPSTDAETTCGLSFAVVDTEASRKRDLSEIGKFRWQAQSPP